MSAKTVAWIRDAGEPSITTMAHVIVTAVRDLWLKANPVQVERYTIPLVLRSDWEAEHTHAEQLAARVDELTRAIATDESDSILDKYQARAERAAAEVEDLTQVCQNSMKEIERLDAKLERAEQALRELLAAHAGLYASHEEFACLSDKAKRFAAAWAAARAIVEGKTSA